MGQIKTVEVCTANISIYMYKLLLASLIGKTGLLIVTIIQAVMPLTLIN